MSRTFTASALAAFALACGSRVEQPVAYSHELHAGKLQIECEKCHEGVMSAAVATLPPLDTCAECHTEAQGKTAEEAKVVAAVAANKPIGWNRLYELPRHVYFSHRRHTVAAKIACERCHGAMAKQPVPPSEPLVALKMSDCLACHAERGARQDCVVCHR